MKKIYYKLEFDESERLAKEFNEALIISICKTCLNNGLDFNTLLFRKRSQILEQFISKSDEAKLKVLVSIQKFCLNIQNCPG